MMLRITKWDASYFASCCDFPLNVDFDQLTSRQVEGVLGAADHRNYRKPRKANGSRARCFHDYLRSFSNRESG